MDKKHLTSLFDTIKSELYTPVVGDILDQVGYEHQFLPQSIGPARDDFKIVGFAMPVLMIDVYGKQKKPFGYLTEALDQLENDDVYIASGGAMRCAYWGELLTATARTRKAAGAVINGFHRDTPQMLAQNWPVFSRGRYAQDSSVRTQVADYRCHIECGQVSVDPGDLVFGDIDGVLIIPQKVAEEVIEKALEKARGEKIVRKAIEGGMTATAAFAKFGIL
ncbi:RraA family protein [Treponema parvum]|uniref:Putative 4-hydroxy-4-methyl-2-oxoglutarate aldolase n=1 Tax=Treponema parvum TaxID=138851 RepID=A0A975EZR9_9SPIR|nr:RraA family protein [Treponema parvum]QTQ11945.1 RraA family protein [Treponema parvum]QTQ16078.1 RraA family protein [Treponema parvum]